LHQFLSKNPPAAFGVDPLCTQRGWTYYYANRSDPVHHNLLFTPFACKALLQKFPPCCHSVRACPGLDPGMTGSRNRMLAWIGQQEKI